MNLKELREKLRAALLNARNICDEVEKAGRDFTAEERQKVAGYMEEAKGLKAAITAAEGDEAMRKALQDLGAGLELKQNGGQPTQSMQPGGRGKSIGEQFTESEAFKGWIQRFPNGEIPHSAKGLMSPPVAIDSPLKRGRKTLLTGDSATSAGAFVETDYTGIYEPLGRLPLTIRDLIAIRQTTSDVVEFVRQTAQITQAAGVAEATATSDSSGSKPEGAMAFEQVTADVKTIAVWIPATKRALSDASQLRGLIDGELRDDIDEELEDQLLNGAGGADLTGLANTANTLTQAFDTDILTTCRKAITSVMVTGRATPTAWVFNPLDWETVDLLTDQQGRYYWGGPVRAGGPPTLWGYPVAQCNQQPQGTAWLGDWRKMVFWDRERTTISVSDSHSDFFIRNMVAVLAEMRGTLGIIRPSAFVEVELSAGS